MEVFIAVIVTIVVLVGLNRIGLLPLPAQNGRLSADLRGLLLDRAAGKIDDEEFNRRQAALHAALLDQPTVSKIKHKWIIVPLIVILGIAAFTIFNKKPAQLDVKLPGPMGTRFGSSDTHKPASGPDMAASQSGGDLKTMASRLAEKLAKDPGNGDGWILLARTYTELHMAKETAETYAKASALTTLDASMLADWADAHVVSRDRKWDAESRKIVQKALAADPKHMKSLALGGSEAFERADYKSAIDFWKRMKAVAPADSMDAKLADANIHEAESIMSGKKPGDAGDKAPKK